jgi:DNA-binding MarR family transcriptional regulator
VEDLSCRDQAGDLWMLLAQTRDVIFKARQKELGRYGTSATRSTALFAIQAIGDKATPAQISRLLFREPHSVSELLSRMEKEGLVSKTKDLDKKNLVRVELTERGAEAYYQSLKYGSIHKIMSALSEEECQQLMSCLKTLRDEALKELGVEPRVPALAMSSSS